MSDTKEVIKIAGTEIEITEERIEALREKIDSFNLDEDINDIKERIKVFISKLKAGEDVHLSDEEKQMMEKIAKKIIADILDLDEETVANINDETNLAEQLGMDSLAFLELFDEFKETFNFEMDVNIAAKYAQNHPVQTYGEFREQIFYFIEKPDEVFKELGLDKEEMLSMALRNIDNV